jgi:hypothetical protein
MPGTLRSAGHCYKGGGSLRRKVLTRTTEMSTVLPFTALRREFALHLPRFPT